MDDPRIARRYAQALFTMGEKYEIVRSVEDDLNAIVSLLRNDANFKDFLLAPYTSREEKIAILDKLFSDRITALTLQVLRVMVEKGRENEVEPMRNEYVKLRRIAEGVVHAVVTSAEPLTPEQRKAIIDRLKVVSGKTIEPDFLVEASLIGGVKVAYDNYVLDGTVRGALSKLRDQLRRDLLKQA